MRSKSIDCGKCAGCICTSICTSICGRALKSVTRAACCALMTIAINVCWAPVRVHKLSELCESNILVHRICKAFPIQSHLRAYCLSAGERVQTLPQHTPSTRPYIFLTANNIAGDKFRPAHYIVLYVVLKSNPCPDMIRFAIHPQQIARIDIKPPLCRAEN